MIKGDIMNHEVYISYSKKDSEIAMQICEAIESNDIKCWIASRDFDGKKDPIEQMANAIQSAENVVLIYSKNAMESQNVKNEISFALSNQISVIPVNVDASSEVPDLFIGANKPKATFQGISDNFKLEIPSLNVNESFNKFYGVKNSKFTLKDLEYLLNDRDEVTLREDIIINEEISAHGIDLNRDNLIIDGAGHSISVKSDENIFNIKSKNITIKNLNFNNCILNDESSIIHISKEASLILDRCTFRSNELDDGHVIFTLGDIDVTGSKFKDHHANNEGTAIYARDGSLNITECEFTDNVSQNSGGAILNWARLNITDSKFINNHAEGYGGAIGNVIDAVLNVSSSEFRQNESVGEASTIYNENRVSCVSCNFTENKSKLSLIFNENKFDMVNCNFKNNTSRIIFQNHENGVSYLSNSKFIENNVMITNVYNNGESFSLEKVEFKNNKAAIVQAVNIYNETYMRLKEPVLDDNTILNREHIDIWKYSPELINNSGTIAVMDEPCDKEFSFNWLERKINQSEDKIIRLENNIRLENCELDFYEGGMEISRSDVTVDGNGHYIDGAKRTAIFHITGKNVTLKNIRFKNANLINDLYSHTTGGSAIRTITSSSLKIENCEFADNECDDDGGAILNKSELEVYDCLFENNTSRAYGGAICNKNIMILKNSEFNDNSSRISQDIFNSRKIFGIFKDENVFDVGDENHESDSFSHLADEISKKREIILNCDIRFDYRHDLNLKDGIEITDIESLTIDGRGFSIDGDDRAGLFNLKNSNVVFKNLTFKNAITQDGSIFENDAQTTFINCRFINNHPSYNKSLINNNGQVKLENCRFINNLSKNRSLISNDNEFEITGCEFSLNSNEKSTIANSGKLSIDNSKFINNHSDENAGALRNEKEARLLVENTLFKSNSTSASGGAVLNSGELIFIGCLFESNFSDGDGGVINNEKDANLEIKDSDIRNNSSKGDGGAVINWGNLSFKNSIFSNNTARKDGGVVNIQKGSLLIEDCEFNKNSAFDGGSLFNRGDLRINNSKFEDNTAKKDGGALNTYDGNIKILKALFMKNNADDGGAIYSREGEILILGSEFLQNTGGINGGAIITWCEMTIEDSKLSQNSAKIYGGAINNQKNLLSLKNCEFSKNNADTGGAIFNVKDDNLKTVDCRFMDNSPEDIY